jgi:hypothetical protein
VLVAACATADAAPPTAMPPASISAQIYRLTICRSFRWSKHPIDRSDRLLGRTVYTHHASDS